MTESRTPDSREIPIVDFEWSDNSVRYWQELCDRVFPFEKRCEILDAMAETDGLAMTNKALAADVSDELEREVTTQTLIGHLKVFEELGIVALLPRWDRDQNSVIQRRPLTEDWLSGQEYQKGAEVAPLSLTTQLAIEYIGWEYRPVSPDDVVLDPNDGRSLLPLKGTLYAFLLSATERVDPGRIARDGKLVNGIDDPPKIELEIGSPKTLSDAAYDQLTSLGIEVPEEEPIGEYWHTRAVVGRVSDVEWGDREKVPIDQTLRRFSDSWVAAPMELYPRQKADDVDPPGIDTEAVEAPDPELAVQRIGENAIDSRKSAFVGHPSTGGGSRFAQEVEFGDGDAITFGTLVRDRITPDEGSIQYSEDESTADPHRGE